jgi:hypothetical protein
MNTGDERTVHIYVLIDPRTNAVRYVGSTLNIQSTLARHRNQTINKKKMAWITELKNEGLKPKIEAIDTTNTQNRLEIERKWIGHYLELGTKLLNWEYSKEYDREAAGLPPPGYRDLMKEFEELWQEEIPEGLPNLTRDRFVIARAFEVAIKALRQK